MRVQRGGTHCLLVLHWKRGYRHVCRCMHAQTMLSLENGAPNLWLSQQLVLSLDNIDYLIGRKLPVSSKEK